MFGRGKKGPDPAAYVVVKDRPWLNPRLDGLLDHLAAQPPEGQVEAVLAELAAARGHAEHQVQIAVAAAEKMHDAEAALRARVARPTGDTAAAGDATALLTELQLEKAWAVRGSGRVETVGENAWPVFHTMLEEADEIGRNALDLVPGHPVAANARLAIGRGLGLPEAEWFTRFAEARKQEPWLYPAHQHMLQAMCKKWYGSHEVMFDFARETAREAPVGSPAGAVLAVAHLEFWIEEGRWDIPAGDVALLRETAERWVAGGEPALAHPQAPAAHQVFAYLLRDDEARVNFHLTRSRGRMASFPWIYMKDGETVFRSMMSKAKVEY